MDMKIYKNQTTYILSIIIAILAAVTSAGGLFVKNLYNDNDFVKAAWYSNDIITLFVVVPLLVITILFSKKSSPRWLMIWIGLLGYMFYNFAFYLFGAVFNIFFLLYAALFSLSAVTLILLLSNSDISNITSMFSKKTPVKVISIYLLLIATGLFLAEMSMVILFLIAGTIPETIKLTAHPTSVIFALDLSIVIPVSIMAAFLLWKRNSWGYVMSIIMLVKGFAYGLVLCLGSTVLSYSDAYGKWDPLTPFYVIISIGGMLGCWLLLKNLGVENSTKQS